jgi:hypothetical protein
MNLARNIAILLLFCSGMPASGQNKISEKDKANLRNSWNRFRYALSIKDRQKLHSLSFDTISCFSCIPFEQNLESKYEVPVDTFINQFFRLANSREWTIILNTDTPILYLNDHSKRKLFGKKSKEILTWYEIIIQATPPDPTTGYEGKQWVFQFVKQNDVFLFWGLTFIG